MRRVAIVQSSYMPWIGYFDLINSVDDFVFLDNVQYTKRDWRSRNKIKTPNGVKWLSVPIITKSRLTQSIYDAVPDGNSWRSKHWRTIDYSYSGSASYHEYAAGIRECIMDESCISISEINQKLIKRISDLVGIRTRLHDARSFQCCEGKNERLAGICAELGGNVYVTGRKASNYLKSELFKSMGIEVEYFDYRVYGPYTQRWGGFVAGLSVIDTLFNIGPKTRSLLGEAA